MSCVDLRGVAKLARIALFRDENNPIFAHGNCVKKIEWYKGTYLIYFLNTFSLIYLDPKDKRLNIQNFNFSLILFHDENV